MIWCMYVILKIGRILVLPDGGELLPRIEENSRRHGISIHISYEARSLFNFSIYML
jgi:hypothetical protein